MAKKRKKYKSRPPRKTGKGRKIKAYGSSRGGYRL